MKLDLLAIAAHPDDVELTCGGTLLKAAEQGYRTGILDLTAGEMGTRGTPETRRKEASRIARISACLMLDWKSAANTSWQWRDAFGRSNPMP
jgi:LmbE family N-acetylglucosaminyl deacetylase